MTREEIISGLQFTIDMFLFDPMTGESSEPRNEDDKVTVDACRGAIELLKSQTEIEPKIGHWIRQTDDNHDYYVCEHCETAVGLYDIKDYCPKCGARMIGYKKVWCKE